MNPKKYSLGLIVLFLIFFWPVAIYMIIVNFSHSSEATQQNSQTANYLRTEEKTSVRPPKKKKVSFLRVLGILLIVIGALSVIGIISSHNSNSKVFFIPLMAFPPLLTFVVGGIALTTISQSLSKKDKLRERYVDIINSSSDISIRELGKKNGRSEEQALRDVQEMLDDGYFPNCYIDREKMEFSFPRAADAAKLNYQTVVTICQSCGAKNTQLAGTVQKCDYCAAPLQAAMPTAPPAPPKPPSLADSVRSAADRFLNKLK